MLQVCNPPKCPQDFQLNDNCECVRESKCPIEVMTSFGCSCLNTTDVSCPPNAPILDRDRCECTFSVAPSCPRYTSLKGNAYCQGLQLGPVPPLCLSGFILNSLDCKCEQQFFPQCSVGTLSDDGCFCIKSQLPSCSGCPHLPDVDWTFINANALLNVSDC